MQNNQPRRNAMSESSSYLDTFKNDGKPESFEQETFVPVRNSRSQTRLAILFVVLLILAAGSYAVYRLTNDRNVPELVGLSLEEANAWATKNRIVLAVKREYNFDIAAGVVISQEMSAGATIRKNDAFSIVVSQGANPDESIPWPDIKTMTLSEIEDWISENKLTGINITTANSDIIAEDHVISYTLTDNTEANFMRKSRATIAVSIGPAAQSETVTVTDFSNMKTGDILQWGRENGVNIVIEETFDDYVSSGNVIYQSVKANTEVVKNETITVILSTGPEIIVPDFTDLTQDEATSWAKASNVTLIVTEEYSSSYAKGNLIRQSLMSETSMKTGDEIRLVYSAGLIDVSSFIGKTKLDILNWQTGVNAKGANISLSFSEAYGEKGTAGKIISQSVQNDTVKPGSKISVVVSLGMRLLAPDLAGKTETECKTIAQSSGLTILFSYQKSSTVANGMVISQSPARQTVMTDDDTITAVIAISDIAPGTVSAPDFTLMTKDEANAWAQANNMTMRYIEAYHDTVPKGGIISQSIASGAKIAPDTTITLDLSLGEIQLSSYIGRTKLEVQNWLNEVNAKGAGITATFTYAHDKSKEMNIVVSQSLMNTSVPTGTAVTFTLSWDPSVPEPSPTPEPTPTPTP
jgi:beta-lactam-binding protein with PASTA domain